eukprot:5774020-Pyramimonas_sp.AAC.1
MLSHGKNCLMHAPCLVRASPRVAFARTRASSTKMPPSKAQAPVRAVFHAEARRSCQGTLRKSATTSQ